jgi:hypothetical protein
MSGQDLTDFLLARIADEKEIARAAAKSESIVQWHAESGHPYDVHVSRWDPARVLAECEAKRRIVEWMGDKVWHVLYSDDVLCALALPYADRPDFDPEWRA